MGWKKTLPVCQINADRLHTDRHRISTLFPNLLIPRRYLPQEKGSYLVRMKVQKNNMKEKKKRLIRQLTLA